MIERMASSFDWQRYTCSATNAACPAPLHMPRGRGIRGVMAQPLTIIGSFVSPYVRKVLACINLKGLAYEVDPITPFYGNDEFRRLSPLPNPGADRWRFHGQRFVGDLRLSR